MNWTDILKTIGSTAAVVAGMGWVAQALIKYVLDKNFEKHKADISTKAAREARALSDITQLALPTRSAIRALEFRLDNILCNGLYRSLSPTISRCQSPGWSVNYDYTMPSTVYLFAQYFCWIRLMEEKSGFELFERKHPDGETSFDGVLVNKESFFNAVREVGRMLSQYPLDKLPNPKAADDMQIFNMQQRALGEILIAGDSDAPHCMPYSEFIDRWRDPEFRRRFEPLTNFLDRLTEQETACRWYRLHFMAKALGNLRSEFSDLLNSEPPVMSGYWWWLAAVISHPNAIRVRAWQARVAAAMARRADGPQDRG